MNRRALAPLFLILTLTSLIMACSSGDLANSNTPEGAFRAAEEYEKDELFEEAITKYSEVKNRFPYSKFAVEAELKIADLHFRKETWVEAQNSYQLFKDLHPKHSKIDYVIFRLGMSYFNQLPSTIDRDLGVAEKAILSFDELTKNYPKSEHIAEAKTKRSEARRMLGEKVLYIAEFYFVRDIYDSALLRYEKLLQEYSNEGFAPQALYGATVSAFEVGDRTRGEEYYAQLIRNHGGSSEARRAQELVGKYGVH